PNSADGSSRGTSLKVRCEVLGEVYRYRTGQLKVGMDLKRIANEQGSECRFRFSQFASVIRRANAAEKFRRTLRTLNKGPPNALTLAYGCTDATEECAYSLASLFFSATA